MSHVAEHDRREPAVVYQFELPVSTPVVARTQRPIRISERSSDPMAATAKSITPQAQTPLILSYLVEDQRQRRVPR